MNVRLDSPERRAQRRASRSRLRGAAPGRRVHGRLGRRRREEGHRERMAEDEAAARRRLRRRAARRPRDEAQRRRRRRPASNLLCSTSTARQAGRCNSSSSPKGCRAPSPSAAGAPTAALHLWYRPPDGGTRISKIQFGEKLKLTTDGGIWSRRPRSIPRPAPSTSSSRAGALGARARGLPRRAARAAARASPPARPGRARRRLEPHRSPGAARAPAAAGRRDAPRRRRRGDDPRRPAGENERRCVPPKGERHCRALARDIINRYPPGAGP